MDYGPFEPAGVELFATNMANELQLEDATDLLELIESSDPGLHHTLGQEVRNWARHWGCGFSGDDLETSWRVLVKAAAERRLEPSFVPQISTEPTAPEDSERLSGESWTLFRVQELADGRTFSWRSFEFYDSGWFIEDLVIEQASGEVSAYLKQVGRFKKVPGAILITTTEYEGRPFPAGGQPYPLPISEDGSSLLYGDMRFNFMGRFLRRIQSQVNQ
jgi:hypothetical protein